MNGETYGYDYDNVGNRRMSMEAGDYAFYLQLSLCAPNAKYYYPIDSNGNYTGRFRWHVNWPNCATFAWNISALYFGFDKEVDWDYAFLFLGRAHRPEEFRQFLHDEQKGKGNQCKTIYTAARKEWQGKE